MGDLKNDVEVVEVHEQGTGETEVAAEGGDVTTVLCAHPHPIQLTSIQAEVTREVTTVPSRTLSLSTVLRSTSTVPDTYNSSPTFH